VVRSISKSAEESTMEIDQRMVHWLKACVALDRRLVHEFSDVGGRTAAHDLGVFVDGFRWGRTEEGCESQTRRKQHVCAISGY
jgi:hypothetical protein